MLSKASAFFLKSKLSYLAQIIFLEARPIISTQYSLNISATQFANGVKIGNNKVIDVRKECECSAEHVEKSYSRPLEHKPDWK